MFPNARRMVVNIQGQAPRNKGETFLEKNGREILLVFRSIFTRRVDVGT